MNQFRNEFLRNAIALVDPPDVIPSGQKDIGFQLQCNSLRGIPMHTILPTGAKLEVSAFTGVNRLSSFSRTFKEETGIYPRRYRRPEADREAAKSS